MLYGENHFCMGEKHFVSGPHTKRQARRPQNAEGYYLIFRIILTPGLSVLISVLVFVVEWNSQTHLLLVHRGCERLRHSPPLIHF